MRGILWVVLGFRSQKCTVYSAAVNSFRPLRFEVIAAAVLAVDLAVGGGKPVAGKDEGTEDNQLATCLGHWRSLPQDL